ncbi:acyltransferase family protein [Phycicoccus sp.]|uniref:acyltransferase n=1 Tax=Phycicoccus sp. TaxID=1902410 RepID=UPI002CF3F0B5|nr:acyltransferase family protein [Phycicoccus sp.]HMM97114.1 acyltransferase family protein [Phycicoccus sp.]
MSTQPGDPRATTTTEHPHALAEQAAELAVPPTSGRPDLAFTSYLRIGAIVSVVLIHVAGLSYVADKDVTSVPRAFASIFTYGTKWAVPVFVMVSGALLLRPPRDPRPSTFYRRRLAKIGVPLVVWHVVYIAIFAVILTELAWRPTVGRFLKGQSFTALYFFWLILGLYLITPLLWPVVQSLSRRVLLVVAVALTALPPVDLVSRRVIVELGIRVSGSDLTLVTQFLPYVGFYVLGYALRDLVLRGAAKVLVMVGTALLCLELVVQAAFLPAVGGHLNGYLQALSPVSYQGPLLGLCAVGVFLSAHAVVAPGSRWATEPWAGRARTLGDLTFGVFCVHQVLSFAYSRLTGHRTFYGEPTIPGIVVQNLLVIVGSFLLTAMLVRVPVLRRIV